MNIFDTTIIEKHDSLNKNAKAFNPTLRYKDEGNKRFQEALRYIHSWYNHQKYLAEAKSKTVRAKQTKVIIKQQTIVESILANFLFHKGKPLSISLSKRILDVEDRYRPKWLTYPNFKAVIKILSSPEIDIIKVTKGKAVKIIDWDWDNKEANETFKKLTSIIELTERGKTFLKTMDKSNLYREYCETIQLRERNKFKDRYLLQYADTDLTERMRTEMETINSYLKDIIIEHFDEGELPASALYRVFYNDFKSHGRLYGGSWYNLKKENRLDMSVFRLSNDAHFRVLELDFRACSLSILANLNNQPLLDPEIDPYQAGVLSKYQREGIKELINAYLSHPSMTRYPKYVRNKLGNNIPELAVVLNEVFSVYPYLKDLELDPTMIESEIVVKVMIRCIEASLVALPFHDALFVADEHQNSIETIIKEVSTEITGYPLFYGIKAYDPFKHKEVTISHYSA